MLNRGWSLRAMVTRLLVFHYFPAREAFPKRVYHSPPPFKAQHSFLNAHIWERRKSTKSEKKVERAEECDMLPFPSKCQGRLEGSTNNVIALWDVMGSFVCALVEALGRR